MPIQIIDNFELGASKPIDNRFVVGAVDSFYADKNDIPYKYIGLRVWDLSGGAPGVGYVWDGTTWQGEAAGSVTSTGSPGYISKFLSPSSTIDDSLLYETPGGNIGLDTTTPDKKLTVNGAIKSITGGFYGNGENITDINASNITTGNLSVGIISPGTLNFILTTGGSGTEWTDPSTITVGKATDADKVYYQESSSTNFLPILFSESTSLSGYHALRSDEIGKLAIRPSDGSIKMADSTGNVVIGDVTPDPNYKVYIKTTGDYGLLVDKRVKLNGYVGILSTPSSDYGLIVNGGDNWPLYVNAVDGYSARFQGRVGIGGSPQNDYMLYIGTVSGRSVRTIGSVGIRTLPLWSSSDGYWGLRVAKYIGSSGSDSKGQKDGRCAYFAGTTFFGSDYDTGSNGVLQITSVNDTNQIDGASFKAYQDGNHIINFVNSVGTNRGKIRGDGASGVLYDTASDRRLKKDIVDIGNMIEKIQLIKPSKFTWKEDNKEGFGFIAQDLFSILPELRPDISTYCDIDSKNFDIDNPIDKNGKPYYYGIDYGKLTPYLTKALQELIDKIKNADSLEELKNSL